MSKQTFISRFSLIIKRLERGPATFEDLQTFLETESDIHERNFVLSIRTLQRDINHIREQFGIEIANERKGDKRYFIKDRPEETGHTQRLLEAYEMVNIVKAAQQNDKFVFFESRQPKGLEHFNGLLHACRNKKITSFRHLKFKNEAITERTVHPLALKEARGRWYLVAVEPKDGKLRTFGLDRIEDIDISKTSFREAYRFDIATLFNDAFGILNEDTNPEKVKLQLSHEQAHYLVNYPLHHSQVASEDPDTGGMLLEMNIKISYDFVMELLSYGETIKVIAPKRLAKILVDRSKKLIKMYNE